MDTFRKSSGAAAATGTSRIEQPGKERCYSTPAPLPSSLFWRTWHRGAVLVVWLVLSTLSVESNFVQNVEAAAVSGIGPTRDPPESWEAEFSKHKRRRPELMRHSDAGLQGIPGVHPLPWNIAPELLVEPPLSEDELPYVKPAPAARLIGTGKVNAAGSRLSSEHVSDEQKSELPTDGDAEEDERAQELTDLQAQCTQLKLDCGWVLRLVADHLRKNGIKEPASVTEATKSLLPKIAEVVHGTQVEEESADTALTADRKPQPESLTAQAQLVLERHFEHHPEGTLESQPALEGEHTGELAQAEAEAASTIAAETTPMEERGAEAAHAPAETTLPEEPGAEVAQAPAEATTTEEPAANAAQAATEATFRKELIAAFGRPSSVELVAGAAEASPEAKPTEEPTAEAARAAPEAAPTEEAAADAAGAAAEATPTEEPTAKAEEVTDQTTPTEEPSAELAEPAAEATPTEEPAAGAAQEALATLTEKPSAEAAQVAGEGSLPDEPTAEAPPAAAEATPTEEPSAEPAEAAAKTEEPTAEAAQVAAEATLQKEPGAEGAPAAADAALTEEPSAEAAEAAATATPAKEPAAEAAQAAAEPAAERSGAGGQAEAEEPESTEQHVPEDASADPAASELKTALENAKDQAWTEEGVPGEAVAGTGMDMEQKHMLLSEGGDVVEHMPAMEELPTLRSRPSKGDTPELDHRRVLPSAEASARKVSLGEKGVAANIISDSEGLEMTGGLGRLQEEVPHNVGPMVPGEEGLSAENPLHPLLNRPFYTVHFLTRAATEARERRKWRNARRALTVGQLETLLQSRSEQRYPRRSPQHPLMFPACYFDAPTQKRMREKVGVLAASLEQLNDAVEALTELGIVVEKQAEVVERAAFTLVYRNRLTREPAASAKTAKVDESDGEEVKGDTRVDKTSEPLVRNPSAKLNDQAGPAEKTKTSGGPSTTEREPPLAVTTEPQRRGPANPSSPELQPPSSSIQVDDDKYKKLIGASGVRRQLRELFASWELARRAAGASEMANEIMRRAETLRRGLVLPLQQDLQQLSMLDSTLSPNHVALQRLVGCKGFVNAVQRTVSRAEDDLYNLGAHAFASEVSLPLMAHDLQHHLADLLEHVVQVQLQHHRALHMRAASLISLHRQYFRSARELQREATARLRNSHLLLATSAQDWQEGAQRLSVGVFQLRVDLARQLVALRTVDKKAARLEGILNLLQRGLEHLLRVERQLQQMRRNSRLRHYWPVLDEDARDEAGSQAELASSAGDEMSEKVVAFEKLASPELEGMKSRTPSHAFFPGYTRNILPQRLLDFDEALSLDLPPKPHGDSIANVPTLIGEVPDPEAEDAQRTLQRLLGRVRQMSEFIQMYKQQSSEAEQLLRHRFHIAQESVQRATGLAHSIMAQPLSLDAKLPEQAFGDRLPSWTRMKRFPVGRTDDELRESAALMRHVNERVRLLDATLFTWDDQSQGLEFPAVQEVAHRIGRVNGRVVRKKSKKDESPATARECECGRKASLHENPALKELQLQ